MEDKTTEKEKIENFDFDSFYKFISSKFIGDDVIRQIYIGLKASWKAGIVPAFLLRGPPGTGKTMITKVVSEFFNANYVFVQATLNTTEDELIYKYIPSESSKSGVKVIHGPLPEALIRSRQKMTVLVIDEFDKTRPSADALLLDYLQNARVSYRIDENEEIIEGSKNNLIVFITSNDMREFSEPLLRRVIVINFKMPDAKKIEQLLRKYFDDERIIKILVTIYKASLRAKLSKPATIQELVQLGHAIQVSPDADFNALLYSFVVKNDEDFEKLTEAINELENESEEREEERLPNVADKIVEVINKNNEEKKEEQNTNSTTTVEQIISRIKLPVDKLVKTVNNDNIDRINDTIESTFNAKIDDKTFHEYSEIVKRFLPEPADRPDILGKFKIVYDDAMRIISDEAMSLTDVHKLFDNNNFNFEAYAEDYVYVTPQEFVTFIANIYDELAISYYTKNIIVAQHKNNDNTYVTVVSLEKVQGKLYKIKLYIKYDTNSPFIGKQKNLVKGLLEKYQINAVQKDLLTEISYHVYSVVGNENNEIFIKFKEFVEDVSSFRKIKTIISPKIKDYAFIDYNNSENDVRVSLDATYEDNALILWVYNVGIYVSKRSKDKNRYSIKDDIEKNIISKYSGEYDAIEGILKFRKLYEELTAFVNKKLQEVIAE